MAFDQLRAVVDNIKRLDPSKIVIRQMSTPESKKLIIELNTDEQLFKKGEDSRGISLKRTDSTGFGGYSSRTIAIKRSKGQRVSNVTLKDTGAFYESFQVRTLTPTSIEIIANPFKDGESLFDRWGEDIIGLQDESLIILIESIINEFIEETKIEILKGA